MTTIVHNNKYVDPNNTTFILEKLKNLPTIGEVKELVDKTFPTWFVTVMKSYCSDYPHLTKNWKHICDISGIKPAHIMIVEDIVFDEAHTVIKAFCNCFTSAGFCVRRKNEYIPCGKCGSAVPTELMWNIFKEKGFEVPEKWSKFCIRCH